MPDVHKKVVRLAAEQRHRLGESDMQDIVSEIKKLARAEEIDELEAIQEVKAIYKEVFDEALAAFDE